MTRERLRTAAAVESLAGAATACAGLWSWSPPAALVCLGALLMLDAWRLRERC